MPALHTPAVPPRLEPMKLKLQATTTQIKALLRIKQEVHAFTEEALNDEVKFGGVLAVCCDFFLRFIKTSESSSKSDQNPKLPKHELPKVTKSDGDMNCADLLRQISLTVHSSAEERNKIEKNLNAIMKHLVDKYHDDPCQVDLYLVLMETFGFVLRQRAKIAKKMKLHHEDVEPDNKDDDGDESDEEQPVLPCDICTDDSFHEYCGANVCGKCKKFFVECMRLRSNLSLRCTGTNNCRDVFGNVDINCRSCRFQQCVKMGMVDEYYYTEMQQPQSADCAVCHRSRGAADEPLQFILGLYTCQGCLNFFASALDNNAYLLFECKKHRSCPVSDAALAKESPVCQACYFARVKHCGLFDMYCLKSQDAVGLSTRAAYTANKAVLFPSAEKCAVCENDALKEPWMGVKCCEPCRGFLSASMEEQQEDVPRYKAYCCPEGEADNLCRVEAAEARRCKYCWFRRMEIEAIIDRWLICNGRTSIWQESTLTPEEEGKEGGNEEDINEDYDMDDEEDVEDDEDDDDDDDDDDDGGQLQEQSEKVEASNVDAAKVEVNQASEDQSKQSSTLGKNQPEEVNPPSSSSSSPSSSPPPPPLPSSSSKKRALAKRVAAASAAAAAAAAAAASAAMDDDDEDDDDVPLKRRRSRRTR